MSAAGGPLVSVVTPFYNTDRYLAECIESVLAQGYGNFEYVLVNNCSTDESASIAARYAARDPRIRLVHNTTLLPQVENYNEGLRQVSRNGKYCKIVQADDWIYPNCLEEMVRAAEAAPGVALVSSYSLYEPMPKYGPRSYVGNSGLPYDCKVLPGNDALRRYLVDYLPLFGSPTCVMYRTQEVLARESFFNLGSPVEDVEACFEVLEHGQFAFVHQVLTFNRREPGSYWWRYSGYDAEAVNRVIVASKYAAAVLEGDELDALMRRVLGDHYRLLGNAALNLRPKDYWRFHREALACVNRTIEKPRLARFVLLALLNAIANPKLAVGNWLAVRELR